MHYLNAYKNIVLLFLLQIILVSCDDLDDLLRDIEEQIDLSSGYTLRSDNSDIFSESVRDHIIYYGQFDFIVVGAGSAGAILAKRLSEFRFKTLLLEAGDVQPDLTDVPGLRRLFHRSDMNWGYFTSPQKYSCLGMNNRQCRVPRGKCLGGTSSLNGMLHVRGNNLDQEFWKDFGISGWSFKDTLPYFKRYENYDNIYGDSGYHGWDGPIYLDYARPSGLLTNHFLKGNDEIYRVSKDYNGRFQMGAGKMHINKHHGKRMSTNRGYLADFDRNYLTVETNAFVHKIVIKNNEAIGVEFIKSGFRNYLAIAKREVIISAGAVNSPQLLMLSGIGPSEELLKHNIPIIADLPVGRNFEDHIGFVGIQIESDLALTNKNKTFKEHVWDYLSEVGYLSNTNQHELVFLATDGNNTYPDIEIMLESGGRSLLPNFNFYNFNEEVSSVFALDDQQIDYVFSVIVMLLHPKSKGTITLQSNNPRDFPIIDSNCLSHPDDIVPLYKSIQYIKKLLETEAFRSINAKIRRLIIPACDYCDYDSKEFWYCTIRHLSHSIFHLSGTCAMGQRGSSVVDSNLRVHGIKGLRVADQSIAPRLNSGHTNAIAMMIGEKAADIIRNNYRNIDKMYVAGVE